MKTTPTHEWRTFDEAPKDGTVVLGSDGIFYKWHTRKIDEYYHKPARRRL
jgi:hypothetical protein